MLGDKRVAASSLEAALPYAEQLADARLGRTLNRLGVLRAQAGQHAEAERAFKRAIANIRMTAGADHPELATYVSNLAAVYEADGKREHAVAQYEHALAIYERHGACNTDAARSLDALGRLYAAGGNDVKALYALRRALSLKEAALGAGDWDTGVTREKLGEFYFRQGRHNEAEPYFWNSVAIRAKALGDGDPALWRLYARLARLYAGQKKYHRAEQLLRYAIQLLSAAQMPDHSRIVTELCALEQIYRQMGRFSQADAIAELIEALASDPAEAGNTLKIEFAGPPPQPGNLFSVGKHHFESA